MAEETMKDFQDEIDRSFRKVKDGDILVGKVTPKGMAELTAEEKALAMR